MPNRRQPSLTNQVISRILLVTLSYAAIMSLLIYSQIDTTLTMLRDKTLVEHGKDLGSYIEKNSEDVLLLDMPLAEKSFYAQAGRFYQYVIRDRNGQILFHSPIAFLDRFPTDLPKDDTPLFFEFIGPHGTHYLGTSVIYHFSNQQYIVQVAQSEKAADQFSDLLMETFLKKISLYGVPFLAVLAVIIILTIRQRLDPIRQVSQQASRITFKSADIRLHEEGMPREIKPLVHAVNEALNRLEDGIKSQREFTANAAHELRTPLSILRAHIDLLQDKETSEKLRKDVDAMSRLVTQLLDAARLDFSENLMRKRFDLAELVRELSVNYWPLMVKQGRSFEITGIDSPVFISGYRDGAYRALANIVDNALIHTPKGTPIHISVNDGIVRIQDSGPGIPDEQKNKVFEKFWRKSGKPDTGAGLGLSIVRRTMELHDGSVHIEDAPGGGCVFVLDFSDTEWL